jgi:hypothetical protein
MPEQVIVWDLETIPDLEAFAAVTDIQDKPETEIREGMASPRTLPRNLVGQRA